MVNLFGEARVAPTPTLLPKTKRQEQRVFLPPELWRQLSEAAEFHTEVFSAMGAEEKVSRNDLLESFLTWALQSYWEDKGGQPTSRADREQKVRRAAEQLRKLQANSKQ